jgi:hypothetical protein
MKSKLLLVLLLLNFIVCLAQSELAQRGTITLADNQKLAFNNLKLIDGKFVFLDVASGAEKQLSIKEIKYVEDDKMSRVFTNKTIEASTEPLKTEDQKELPTIKPQQQEVIEKTEKIKIESTALHLIPDGIYKTKEDFLNKKISSSDLIIPKPIYGFNKQPLSQIVDHCFFYYGNDDKVKRVFAISYKGHLYFQLYSILLNRNKTDRAQTNDHPNSFVRVLSAGENYYYMEAELANAWAQGFAYGGIGGASGAMLANGMIKGKGVVWDIKNKEFNIFKNCDDYNNFIKDKFPEGVQKCDNHQPDMLLVRTAIEKIK